jgi:uncharacterized UBP type Zn finger protein
MFTVYVNEPQPQAKTKGKKVVKPVSLEDAIEKAMEPEIMSDNICESCKRKTGIKRSFKLKSPLPPVLIIEVRRCMYERSAIFFSS